MGRLEEKRFWGGFFVCFIVFCCCLEIVYRVEEKVTVANTALRLYKWGETLMFFRIFNFL